MEEKDHITYLQDQLKKADAIVFAQQYYITSLEHNLSDSEKLRLSHLSTIAASGYWLINCELCSVVSLLHRDNTPRFWCTTCERYHDLCDSCQKTFMLNEIGDACIIAHISTTK